MLALNSEVDEKSELFRCLYPLSSTIIHHHRNSGLCFRKLIRTFDAHLQSKKCSSDYSELASEVREAPSRAQELVEQFCGPIFMGYFFSYRVIVIDRLLRRFRSFDYVSFLQRMAVGSAERGVLSFLKTLHQAVPDESHGTLHDGKVVLHSHHG